MFSFGVPGVACPKTRLHLFFFPSPVSKEFQMGVKKEGEGGRGKGGRKGWDINDILPHATCKFSCCKCSFCFLVQPPLTASLPPHSLGMASDLLRRMQANFVFALCVCIKKYNI